MPIDAFAYNRGAWDKNVDDGDRWTIPVSAETIAEARQGAWSVLLTPRKPVPRAWFPRDLRGTRVLCLASGGGQQGPIFAAAGAAVTVFDASPKQLGQDRRVAERERLPIETVEGDMRDLSAFGDERFDLVFHPVSNCFCPEVRPVWQESFRVLRPGGVLLAGFTNPVLFTFDPELSKQNVLTLRYPLPYSDLTSLTDEERQRYTDGGEPLCFGHTLDDQIGGQLDAGFVLTGFYEDLAPEDDPSAAYLPVYIATRAAKPA